MENNILFVLPKDAQTGVSTLSRQYTLRACNRDFRTISGSTGTYEDTPELDNNKVPGKIAPFVSYDNEFGHWVDDKTRVFEPTHFGDDFNSLRDNIRYNIQSSIRNGNLWDLTMTKPVSYKTVQRDPTRFNEFFYKVSSSDTCREYNPFSAHPVQAYIESEKKRGRDAAIFKLPSQSTVVTGIHGGLSNNVALEMGFEEAPGTRNPTLRTYDTKLLGFVCAGHTAHSGDAGKSRRLTSYTRVRVVHPSILDIIDIQGDGGPKDWIIYCMGFTCEMSYGDIWKACYDIISYSQKYYDDQFDLSRSPGDMLCPPSFTISEDEKIMYVSISSGVVLRSVPGNSMIDSHMFNYQKENTIVEHTKPPKHGLESLKYWFSAFFLIAPFVEYDRPPRTLFASGQTTQGIFLPWSVGSARVSPQHVSKPLVATQFVRDIERDNEENPGAMWDVFSGEDLTVCYMNLPLNYEDSMVLSSAFSDRGGFATLSLCTYRISESDDIPEEGEKLCGKKYKWWKVACTDTCVCKYKNGRRLVSTSGRVPSGTVHQILRTEDGAISIKVLSFSQILTGDKISTMHGQKGVVRIVPQENLPMIVLKDGSIFHADLYIAVGSIVSRQTNGQIFESAHGLRAAREGKLYTTQPTFDPSSEECDYVMNPMTGKIITRELPSGTIEPIRATIGITRIINQTQMTRERHHLTHRSEGKGSTGTHSGRADGGGVAASEMDFQVMYAKGLYSCAQEFLNRGNMTIVPVCRTCLAIKPLHDCGGPFREAKVRMPYDSASFDGISAAVSGTCNRYRIEHI